LLSAAIGGRAQPILVHQEVEAVFVAAPTLAEVHEYAPRLANKRRLLSELVLLAAASLPAQPVVPSEYAAQAGAARRRIGRRDPDDVDTLALALHFKLPIWSNDRDFEDAGVELYTTAQLLDKLSL
jgi:predicted nucleic acid-binding protein